MTATTDKPYTWEDSDAEAKILLPLDAAIKTKDVTFKLIPTALTLGIKGKARDHALVHVLGGRR